MAIVHHFASMEEMAEHFEQKGVAARGEAEFYREKNKSKAEARALVRAMVWEEAASVARTTVITAKLRSINPGINESQN